MFDRISDLDGHYGKLVLQWPATQFFPAVDNATKQLGSFYGVIECAVRISIVKLNTSGFAGSSQHRLAVGQA